MEKDYKEKLRADWDNQWRMYGNPNLAKKSIADYWIAKIDEVLEAERKAFGGCTKCYGKGYATTIEYAENYEDFGGEQTSREKLPLMRFCSCDRGKQLSVLTERS